LIARGFFPTLAIVMQSVVHDREAIYQILNNRQVDIFGATTNGEFIEDTVGKESIAMLLLDMDKAFYKVYFEEFGERDDREVAASIAQKALSHFSNPAFLISASHLQTDAEQLLLGVADVVGPDVNIYGGMAGDDFQFKEQFVFTNNQSSTRGMVILALDENKIKIKGRATCGWKAIGTEKVVTKSVGNHVYTVDDIPVLDMTIKYGGLENVTPDSGFSMDIAAALPLQLQRENGDPVMRPGLLVDWKDHSFYCSGSVPQGSKVRFSIPPDFDVIEKVIEGCEELKKNEMPEADAMIVFSCGGRLAVLGPLITEEIKGMHQVWNVPMVGMFSNAEMARATGGRLEMHNLTTCCVTLKEK
jgi:hypothetical protein